MEAVLSLRTGQQVLVCLAFLLATGLERKRGARHLLAVPHPQHRGNARDEQAGADLCAIH
eukprot:COSAG02_NODE_3042_length_7484_cov_13.494110_5_plen_60_part_00